MSIPTTLSAQRLQGIALTIIISTVFAALWGLNGSAALVGMWRVMTAILVVLITCTFFIAAATFRRAATHQPIAPNDSTPNPFRTWPYRLAVLAEVITIPLASRMLVATGHADSIISVVAIIAGLHFFGLIPAFHSWNFAWVGGAFCVLALVALVVPSQVILTVRGPTIALRTVLVGFGCAIILWLSVLPITMTTRRQLAGHLIN